MAVVIMVVLLVEVVVVEQVKQTPPRWVFNFSPLMMGLCACVCGACVCDQV